MYITRAVATPYDMLRTVNLLSTKIIIIETLYILLPAKRNIGSFAIYWASSRNSDYTYMRAKNVFIFSSCGQCYYCTCRVCHFQCEKKKKPLWYLVPVLHYTLLPKRHSETNNMFVHYENMPIQIY